MKRKRYSPFSRFGDGRKTWPSLEAYKREMRKFVEAMAKKGVSEKEAKIEWLRQPKHMGERDYWDWVAGRKKFTPRIVRAFMEGFAHFGFNRNRKPRRGPPEASKPKKKQTKLK